MNTTKIPQAGIIGAGIGGLSAAIALRRAGWQCEVFERSSFKNEIGAAITVTPNATRCLDRWGFNFDKARPTENRQFRLMSAEDLKVVYRQDYPHLKQQFGYKSWSFHRVDLHKGLLDLAVEPGEGKGCPANIRLSCEVEEVNFENGTIVLSDGSFFEKDLIVVADGAHSHIVNQLSGGSSTLKASGRSIYRCLIPMERLMSDPAVSTLFEDQGPGFLGIRSGIVDRHNDVFFASYACRGNEVLNCAIVHNTRSQQGDHQMTSWNEPASLDDILQTIQNFHPTARKILELASTDGADIKVYNLMIREALSTFVRDTTVVIGDAAHVMLPTYAAGGAVTIESAACLGELFEGISAPISKDLIKKRLGLYDELRLGRCNMTMLLSNAGFAGISAPGVEAEVRKFYQGPVPQPGSISWSAEIRAIWFEYDVFEETAERLELDREREGGVDS
ncbi:3-hydroxybenzoate 6-hydroxylase [Venturia nashicola]|uniref:3-hydroxybenzoate 6-hydroxylase n=1 Tax=Venturia nashicola TaxID=86259 RepID=A0A4Z1PJ53_9PEZI|nr:3-hydroxybenzoate 6-hydroxylase [Venturia nashicola]